MIHQLGGWGAAVEAITDPQQVLPLLQQAATDGNGFRAVVIDQSVGDHDPCAIAAAIAAQRELAGVRVILATAPTLAELRRRAPAAGFAAALIKPCSPAATRAALVPEIAAAPAPSIAAAGVPVAPIAAGLRVLIAEDNKVNQVVITKLLERQGCVVAAVDNGRAALEALRRAPYDVVFMDVQMPEMDGIAATAAIRALPQPERRDVWIIALTANAFAEDHQRCHDAGMNDFVAKPVKPADLAACLGRLPAALQLAGTLVAAK
jgi:CheY-like chemotaxis protein